MSNTLMESPLAGQTPGGRYDNNFKAGSTSDSDRPVQPDDLVVLTRLDESTVDEQVRVCKAKDLLPSSVSETFNLATPDGSMTLNVLAGMAKPVNTPSATSAGATEIEDGGYKYYIYKFSGDTKTFTPTSDGLAVDYLIVAPGGGGGHGLNNAAGGGGAGGVLSGTTTELTKNEDYVVTVGAGGAGATDSSATGSSGSADSTFTGTDVTLSATAGGGGSGTAGQGNNGGRGYSGTALLRAGGGGGGYTAAGETSSDGFAAANGGDGIALTAIWADAVAATLGVPSAFAGGGGGGYSGTGGGGNGGSSVGGNGGNPGTAATNAVANSGSGGGGGHSNGGNGSAGLVILRFAI